MSRFIFATCSRVIADWTAAQILFHESSHAPVRPIIDAFAAESAEMLRDDANKRVVGAIT